MSSLAARVLRTIRRERLILSGSRVLVAVSGGPDSVALAHVLHDLQRAGAFTIAGLAHLNHRIRGEAADADERFCRDLAARLGFPIEVETVDVQQLARERDLSLEAAGRRARYEFFDRAAARLEADRIAVGHTRNDQAETFLLRLLRGAGPGGLAGIRPRLGSVVRPLLDATRGQILEYLRERDLAFREDASNADVSVPRNRVRHELIPFLTDRFSPGVVDVLAREAAIMREDSEWLDRSAIEITPAIVLSNDESRMRLDAARLDTMPAPLARRVVRDVLQELGARKEADGGQRSGFASFEHIDGVLALEDGRTVDLHGARATRAGAEIVIERAARRRGPVRATESNSFRYLLSIPGEVQVPEAGWTISAEMIRNGPASAKQRRLHASGDEVLVQGAELGTELAVRSRRPGDAFRPLGLGGRKKLQDFFVDRKVARAERDRVPLVVDDRDRIVWVVGQTVAEEFRVTEPAKGVILLKARRLGGQG